MNKLIHVLLVVFVSIVTVLVTGCDEAYANKKQAMQNRWQQSAASAKIPVIEGLIEQDNLGEAKEMLAKCLKEDPQLAKLHIIAGRIDFIEGRTEQARKDFQKGVDLDPASADGWHLLGSLALMENDYELALEYDQKALELMPANAEYRVSVAEVLIEQDRVSEAKDILQTGLQTKPRDLDLLLSLAQLYQREQDIEQAIQLYEQAQLMHGNNPQVLEPCGYAYAGLQKWDKATEKFTLLLGQCEAETPHYYSILRVLAMCAFNAEKYGLSLHCYNQLLLKYRDDSEIWMGLAQSSLGMDDAARAVQCAQKALQYEPGWNKGYAVLGSALYVKGDYEQSLDAFDRITTDNEFAAFAWFMTGRCYQRLGQTAQADSAFDQAEQLDPENDLVRMFLKRTLQSL